jgi:hypothetical protein
MKFIYIVLISIIFSSCSTIKLDEKIVNDFIVEKQLNHFKINNKIYLIKEATSYRNVLDYYEMAFSSKDLYPGESEFSSIPHKLESWPISMEEIKILKLKYEDRSSIYQWDKKNFKSPNIFIINRTEFLDNVKNNTIVSGSIGHIISKPILSLDKKHAFFTYSNIYLTGGIEEQMYLVENQNGQWKILARFYKDIYYQPVLPDRSELH